MATNPLYSTALLSLVHGGWPDVEVAQHVAATVAFLGEIELKRVAPELARNPLQQHAIAATLYTARSKSGAKYFPPENLARLSQCAKEFARKMGEVRFFEEAGMSLRLPEMAR